MPKIILTKSLISSYNYIFKRDDGWDDFLRTLNREKSPPTEAMLNGQQFENISHRIGTDARIQTGIDRIQPGNVGFLLFLL